MVNISCMRRVSGMVGVAYAERVSSVQGVERGAGAVIIMFLLE